MFGRGLNAANRHGATPSWAFASFPTPSDRSTTASIPFFWGFSSSGTFEDVAAAKRARARDDIVRLVHRTTGVHDFAWDVKRILERAVPFDGVGLLTVDPATLLHTSEIIYARVAVSSGVYPELAPRFVEIELREPDFNKFHALARQGRRAASLSEATRVISNRASATASSADRLDTTTRFASCAQTPPGPGAT